MGKLGHLCPFRDWTSLSQNPNISFDFILKTKYIKGFKWNIYEVSKNPNITFDMVDENPYFGWNWVYLSSNPNLTFDYLSQNLNRGWDWSILSKSENIHIYDILKTLHIDNYNWSWIFEKIEVDPNATHPFEMGYIPFLPNDNDIIRYEDYDDYDYDDNFDDNITLIERFMELELAIFK